MRIDTLALRWVAATFSAVTLCAATANAQEVIPPSFEESGFLAKSFTSPNGGTLMYHIRPPTNYDATKKYPLLLVLHFSGSDGTDDVAPYSDAALQAKYPSFIVAPFAECGHYCWGGSPALWGQEPQEAHGRMAVELVKALTAEFSIDIDRLYLSGHSMGSWGVWDVAERNPDMFAAMLAMDGAGDPLRADRILNMALWNCEGDSDFTMYDVTVGQVVQAREMRDKLVQLGALNFHYKELPGDHGVGMACSHDPAIQDWLFGSLRHGSTANVSTGGAGPILATGGSSTVSSGAGGAPTGGALGAQQSSGGAMVLPPGVAGGMAPSAAGGGASQPAPTASVTVPASSSTPNSSAQRASGSSCAISAPGAVDGGSRSWPLGVLMVGVLAATRRRIRRLA